MTASAVAGLLPFPLTMLVLWTAFAAVQQTACMPVQPPPSPAHGDGMVPPWYPNTQPNSTTKVDVVDKDPATATPASSSAEGLTTTVSGGTHTTGRLPTTMAHPIPNSTTQDGVHSTSTRETTALLSTTGTHEVDVTTDRTGHAKNATITVTPPPDERTGVTLEQGGEAKMTTPASKATEATSVSEVIKVSESADGRNGKGLMHSWQGDDSSVFERATEQPQVSDGMGRNGESYQATTTDVTAQQTDTKPDTTPLHTTTTIKHDLTSQAVTSMKLDTTGKSAESSHQEESTQTSSDPKTVQSQSTTADPTTANSLSTTVGSTTTQSKIDTTTTHSPSMRVDLTTTQSPSTTAGPASVHQTQVTSRIGQNPKAQQPTAPREHGVSVSSQTAQTAAETTTLRPTEEMTQKHDILQPALPAHTDEREEVATIGTNQELPQGWQRDGGSVQDGGRSKNVEETGQSGDMEENTTNRNVPSILTTEPGNVQTTQIMPTSSSQQTRMAQTIHLQTTTGMPDGTEQSTQKIQPTTPRSENDQGVTQRLDKDQRSTTLQTTVAISSEDRIATEQSAEMEQKLTTAHPTKPSEDDHQLTTSFSVQPSSAETSTVTQTTQNENLQTEQQQTKSNNDESLPDTQSITTTSTTKATTEMMPTEVPRYLEAEVLIPEEVTVQERQGQEEHLDKEEQPTVSSSQEGGDDSWQQHVEVMVPADVLCEQVPDGMAELPLFADSSVSGLHTDVSLEDIYQGSGDISVQSESTETSEEITEDAVGQYGMDETIVATTAAMSDEAFERIESGESLQDEGEHAEAMSLFTDSKAEQTDEEKTKESKQEEGSKVQEELSEKPVQVMELVTEPSNQDKETTEHITQSSNEVRETTEYVTQPSNQDRETTVVYKPPSIVTYGPFDPLLADEQGEGILPTDLTVSSKDERGSASDKQDSMSTNLQETTTQTTTGVVTADDRMGTELTSAAPSKETTVTTDTLFTKEEEQKVISFVSTIPVSTSTTVAKMTSGSSARTRETSTAVESASTTTVHPTTSIGATTKMSKTTERPVALTTTDRQATTSQADPLDSEMFTSESDLVAHMIGKITANQEGPKTESPDESNLKVESSTVDTTLSSTLPQTTEADFLSTQTPFSEEDGTTVRNTLTVESTEEPKASEKESSTYEASDIAMEATQAIPRIENTTSMVANAKNMQDLTTDKAESSSSETKSSTKIPSSMKTVTMSSSGVKEVLPTRNAPALRDIITVKLSKMVEVVTEPTMASTEQTRTTTTKSAPGASTVDTHMTTVLPAVTGQKLMGSTDKPKMMTTRGTETTSVHAAPTEHTTTMTETSPVEIAVQTSDGNNGKEEEESLHVDGSYNTSNQTEEMLNTPSHATAATVQPTSAAVSEKHIKTTDISAASQLNVEVTTTFPKTSTVQPALVTTPKVTVRKSITSAETTKETSMPVLSTKTTAMQKVEEPRRLPAIITVLTAQPPVHMPVATDEPNFSTKLSLPESTDPTSTSVVTDPIPQTTVKPTTSKTVAEREKNVGKMTETTSVPTKPTEARTQGITTTEPMKDITTEGTVSLFTSDMVTSTAVTEVSTAFDDVEILDVDQSASGGETAGSLYLDKYPDTDDNAVVPFQKEGENVEKKAPLDTTSTTPPSILPTEEMDMTTEFTTKMTPRPTEPITLSPVTLGGSDQQDNIPSSTEQHTAEMTTKATTTTTTKFSSTKQSEAQPTTTTQRNMKTTSSTNMSTTYVPPTPSEFDSETTKLEHTLPKTSLGATTGSSEAGNQTVLDTTVLPTSLPTTSTNVDKTQQPASPPTAVLTTSIMIDRESETSTRVQEIPENERHLPAVINVLTMRPITTTPGATTVQPKEATKKDSVTTSTALSSTERKNLIAEKVLSASATTAGPQTTEKTFSTEAMLTTESPLYRTTTIPQTDVTDKTDDRTPTAPLSIISSDQSAADKAAGSLHEGQPPDNKGMIPTTEQNKGKDVSSTTVTPSSATETSANLFPTTQGKMSSTLKTTGSPTTQGMPLTTNGSASGSKQVEGEVTDESTRQIAKTTKSPETRTLSNPATTSLLVLNKESDTLEETTDGTTEEILTANTIARSEDETTAADLEPSITQTLRSTTPTVPGGMPVRNAAAIITVLTARPPRVQTDASFPTTISSTTTEKPSTVAPVEIVEGTTSEHIPMSVMTTEMLETSTSAVHDKTNNPTEDTTTVLSRSTPPTTEESVQKGGPLSVTEKIMLEKDLNTTRETATTSEMLSDISEETTVTLPQVTGFHSTNTGKTTKSTLLNTQTTRKLSTAPETTTTPLPKTMSVLPTTQSAENANRESQVKNAGTTSQASGKAASNGTAVISGTSTLAPMTTTIPKKTTHTGDDMTNTDKTATTRSAFTVTTMKETGKTVAMKDAALRKMSTTEAPKTTTAETTARPTDTARSTSTRMMDKRQEERFTPTVTAKQESEAPQGTTRMSTPEQKSTEKMFATTTSGIEPTTRGAQETTTLPGVQSTSESIQVVNLEDEAETTELTVDGRVPL